MTLDSTQPDTEPDEQVRTSDLRPLLAAMKALCDGDFTARVEDPDKRDGAALPDRVLAEMAGVFQQIVARNAHLASELQRVRHEIIRQGRLEERISASPGTGTWTTNIEAANTVLEALVVPVAKATRVLDAVADGDLTQHVDLHEEAASSAVTCGAWASA